MRSQSGLGIFLLKVYERYQCPSFVTFLDPTNKKHFYLEADFIMGRICKSFPPYSFSSQKIQEILLWEEHNILKIVLLNIAPTSPFTMDTKSKKI